ncbi:helix-turn-helix domain-containing protein [Shouchella shacheensis]|uniref:helix-turn-helix domain-containing protein n=1 Tax=Shouchella shacheensis TaxID=1649580 RepID=UPI00073FB409|nr:helix-turn-helix domain-containing protein [Shouchella shacheensis]
MELRDYLADYLEKTFGEITYQIWRCDSNSGSEELLEGQGKRKHPPEWMWEVPGYYTAARANDLELHFYYPEKSSIVLRMFHLKGSVDDSVMKHLYYSLHALVLESRVEMKKQEQNILIESMHSITSSLELNAVLKTIIRHALKVIPSADAGYLMLYNPVKQKLIPKAPVGFNDNIYNFETKVGESITGKVFEDGKGRIYNSYDAIVAGMRANHVLPENFSRIHEASDGVEGAICVPVSIDEKRIGVMIIHQREMKKKLDEEDVKLLEAFATQAAIAIENAQYHTETKHRLKQITSLSRQLEEKNIQLQKRQEVHHTLTMLSLKNRGITLLIDGMKTIMEREILFFNGLENSFYTTSENSGTTFSIFEVTSLFSKRRGDFYVDVLMEETESYFVYPIYNGTVFLGCLFIPLEEPISEFDRITIEQGSTVLALEMVNRQTATKIYHRRIYEQFQELLASDDRNVLLKRGRELHLDTAGFWIIVVLEIPQSMVDLQYLDIQVHRLATRISKALGDRDQLVYGFYNKINMLLSLSHVEEVQAIKEKLVGISSEEESRDGVLFRGGLSSVYKGLGSIGKCDEEANRTISYLASRNSLDVIRYEEIGLNRLFLHQPAEDIEQFIQETLAPITTGNSRHPELEKTLFTYMETNRSPGKTAKRLHIHINTFYQRMHLIEKLLDIDLNDSEDALRIQIACHLKSSRIALGER